MDEMKARGSGPWYVAAAVATLVSTDTSWRFFGERLHITWLPEKVALFAVLEIALFAAAYSMRAGVRRAGTPGSARLIAWGLAGLSGYMAVELSGPLEGLARVLLGPVLAIIALHQALGIEIKTRVGMRTGTLAVIGRELRERALSRLNLGDDTRDAKRRTAERAAVRAATIATSSKPSPRKLRAAVLKSGAATDATVRALLLDTTAALRTLDELSTLSRPSPWTTLDEPVSVPSVQGVPIPSVPRPRLALVPTSGGPAIGWDVTKVVRLVQEGRPSAEIQDAAGVTAKTVQRVTRVVRAVAQGLTDEQIVRGDMTQKYVTTIREAMA
jgi:hypothetical protein